MPNTPIEVVPYPIVTQDNIDDLISFFNTMYDEEHPHRYIVTELYSDMSTSLPLQVYELTNIQMDLENGIIIVSDDEEKLWNEKHYLHTIIAEHIDYITFHSPDNMDAVTLTICKDGSYGLIIRIYY